MIPPPREFDDLHAAATADVKQVIVDALPQIRLSRDIGGYSAILLNPIV